MIGSREKVLGWLSSQDTDGLAGQLSEAGVPPMLAAGLVPILRGKLATAVEAATDEELDTALIGVIAWIAAFLSDPAPAEDTDGFPDDEAWTIGERIDAVALRASIDNVINRQADTESDGVMDGVTE